MSYYGENTIGISTKGSASTEFTSATFKASVTKQGKTGLSAKEQALPVIESIKKNILLYATKAGINTDQLKTTFSVDLDTNRNTGEFIGYKAVYTISFTGTNVSLAPAVHDALTSIEGVQAPTPIYNLDDSAPIHAKAFADAVGKAKIKFQDQCNALGLNVNDYEVTSWSIQEDQPRGKTLSFTEGATAKPVGLEPGKAALDMTVSFAFKKKDTSKQTPGPG